MTWFRRGRDALTPQHEPAPAPAPAEDDPATLRVKIADLNRYINVNSGRIPGESVVTARWVTDTLRDVVDTTEVRPLDIYTLVSVKGMLNDYLPTTLSSYLALDPQQAQLARPSGRTPAQSLAEQLSSLLDAASNVLVASQAQDADALLAQGNFLQTKFSRSDLDL
jgi:hypothetical protein